MKDHFENILKQKLTRKEFLKYIGSGLLVLSGVSGLLKALQVPANKNLSSGSSYGLGVYGGRRK